MNPWRSLRGLPKPLFVLALANFVNAMGTMVLPFLALYLTQARGYSPELAGRVVAAYGFTILLASPLAGKLCDRFGPRRVAILALLFAGVARMLFPLARGLPVIVLATCVLALFSSSFRPASSVLFSQLAAPEQRNRSFALQRLGANLGMSVGPAMGGVLAAWWFPSLFLVDGVTSVLAVLPLWLWVPDPSAPADPSGAAAAAAVERSAYRDGRMLAFMLPLVIVCMVFFQLDAALPIHLVDNLGLDESQFGLMFTINTILIIFLEVAINARTERWPPGRTLALGAVLVTLGFAATGLARNLWHVALTVVVWTFGEMVLLPAATSHVARLSPKGREGEYMGVYSMGFGLCMAVGPWAGTFVLERWGPNVLWSAVLGVGLVASVLLLTVRDRATTPSE